MRPVCYLDLDGVLVDFTEGALRAHGKTVDPCTVRWDFYEQLDLTAEEFWKPFGYDFWKGLKWTDEGPWFLNELEKVFGKDIVVMTAPCDTEGSVEGKVAWIKKQMPEYKQRFFIGPTKHLAAGPNKVLVDDNHDNIDKFVMRRGKAVLVPRPWNRLLGETNTRGQFDVPRVIQEVKRLVNGY